jgi:hypothetical protein
MAVGVLEGKIPGSSPRMTIVVIPNSIGNLKPEDDDGRHSQLDWESQARHSQLDWESNFTG